METHPEPPQAAILKSTANEIFHWSMSGSLIPLAEDIEGYTQLLYRNNTRIAYVNDSMVTAGLPDSVKLLVLPSCYAMYQPTADAIIKWVKNGGTLVCEAHTGAYNLTAGRHCTDLPGMGMWEAFGLQEHNSTAAVHLGLSGDASIGGGLSSDMHKAISAFGLAGGEAVPLITKTDDILWGWSRYTELKGDDLAEIASLPGRGPCAAYKKVGKGTVYYIGTLAGKLWMNPGSPGLDLLMRLALESAEISASSTGIEWAPKNIRTDILDTKNGTAYALSNRGTDTIEFTIPCSEPLKGIYTETASNGNGISLKLEAGQAELVVPLRWLE
jgi:hypothetical protein